MNWNQTLLHELLVLCWLTPVFFFMLSIVEFLQIPDRILWLILLAAILISIVHDDDAYIVTPSIYTQLIRVSINCICAVIGLFIPNLVCVEDENSFPGLVRKFEYIHMTCYYGWVGQLIVNFAGSLFITAMLRTAVTGVHLIAKVCHSIWVHFNDEDD